MPLQRGSLREPGGTSSADGGVFYSQDSDNPDDVIVVDLRKDEESLNWTKFGPEDSSERFCDWSDEKAEIKLAQIRKKLYDIRDH